MGQDLTPSADHGAPAMNLAVSVRGEHHAELVMAEIRALLALAQPLVDRR